MPLAIAWLQESRVIYQRYSGVMTSDDLLQIEPMMRPYLEAGEPPVHLIIDLLDLEEYPKSLRPLKEGMATMNHARVGWTLLIATDALMRFMAFVTTQFFVPRRT